MASSNGSTTERILDENGQFFDPRRDPNKYSKVVKELERKAKINRLSQIEKEMEDLKERLDYSEKSERELKRLNTLLTEQNEKLIVRLDALTSTGEVVVEKVEKSKPLFSEEKSKTTKKK